MSSYQLPPPAPRGVSRKSKGWTIAIAVLFVLWLIGKVSGGDSDHHDASRVAATESNAPDGGSINEASASPLAAYVVTTTSSTDTQVGWSATGATAGQFDTNMKVLQVPSALQGTPVKVCWHMDGTTNSLETADGPDDVAMALGTSIPADDSNLTGDGCAGPVTLQKYLEVLPEDNWSLVVRAVTQAVPEPTTSVPAPTPTPSPTHHKQKPAPVSPHTHVSSSEPASCYPLSNGGNCYRAGEFCRHSDEGVRGVAENGEAIVCEDNDGLRWEPV